MRFLKAGTVQRLVESLANDDGELESTYINVFLATYRAFTTPREVLELLLSRYDALDEGSGALTGEQHRKTLVQALHVWLDAYPGDWKSPPNHPLLSRVLDFTHRRLPGSELELKARHRLHRFQREDQIGKIVIKLTFVSLIFYNYLFHKYSSRVEKSNIFFFARCFKRRFRNECITKMIVKPDVYRVFL